MLVTLSPIPQLRQTAPPWARSLPNIGGPQRIEESVSAPVSKIVSDFQGMPLHQKIARIRERVPQIRFIQMKVFEALHRLVDKPFTPANFEALYNLSNHIEGAEKKERWKRLIADITERLNSSEIREYNGFAKFITLCNILNNEWFSKEGVILYKNQGSTGDPLEEFNALTPAFLHGELHHIVNGRPLTTYFLHNVNSETVAPCSFNHSQVGYSTCNLDLASMEAKLALDGDQDSEKRQGPILVQTPFGTAAVYIEKPQINATLEKASRLLKERYRDAENFFAASTTDQVLSYLCLTGDISAVERDTNSQLIGANQIFHERFIDSQLKEGKLKKLHEHFVTGVQNKKEAKRASGYILSHVAQTLQRGFLSLDPKITLVDLIAELSESLPMEPLSLSYAISISLLADELHEKININEDPLDPDTFFKMDLGKLAGYVDKLIELPDEDLTNTFETCARREFKSVLDESKIVLVE